MSFIVTCRYDYNSPLELAKILEFLRTFDDVVASLEVMAEGEKKDHVHVRISHNLNIMAFGRLKKKNMSFPDSLQTRPPLASKKRCKLL